MKVGEQGYVRSITGNDYREKQRRTQNEENEGREKKEKTRGGQEGEERKGEGRGRKERKRRETERVILSFKERFGVENPKIKGLV